MESMFTTIVAGINVVLIVSLLYVYLKNVLKIRSGFTYGLFLFTVLFLFHNVLVLYFSITMMPLYAEGVAPYMFAFSLLQLVAFAILNWVTWK